MPTKTKTAKKKQPSYEERQRRQAQERQAIADREQRVARELLARPAPVLTRREQASAAVARQAARERAASLPTAQGLSLSDALLAADRAYREETDGATLSWAATSRLIGYLGDAASEWAGVPMPLHGEQLVIEERYPWADALAEAGFALRSGEAAAVDEQGRRLRNVFWSSKLRCDVLVWEEADGRRDWDIVPGVHHLTQDLQTLGCQDAWSLEAEFRAIETLRGLVSHRQMRQYLLTGMFLETSQRSRVTYVFRRLKPTVAIGRDKRDNLKILAALCLHPLAHYAGSWAGALCPTDDVIAHLMLMRGDEPMFWRRANQHPAYRPEAGL